MAPSDKSGVQYINIGKIEHPMYFYGWKCYFQIQKSTSANLAKYPIIKLISSIMYEPQRSYSRRVHQTKLDVDQLRARLVFPPIEDTNSTLVNYITIVQTLPAETREYMRDHYKKGCGHLDPIELMMSCIQTYSFPILLQFEVINTSKYLLTSIQILRE